MKSKIKSFAAFWAAYGNRWYRDGYMPPANKQVTLEIIEAWETWKAREMWKGAEQLEMFKERPS